MIRKSSIFLFALIWLTTACGSSSADNSAPPESMLENEEKKSSGIELVTEFNFEETVDQEKVLLGKKIFDTKCVMCHPREESPLGPSLVGLYDKRDLAWTMNMILHPEYMIKNDPIALELFNKYNGIIMMGQGLDKEDAQNVMEYLRVY